MSPIFNDLWSLVGALTLNLAKQRNKENGKNGLFTFRNGDNLNENFAFSFSQSLRKNCISAK